MSKTPLCPLLDRECEEHACMFWTHVQMTVNPQTGASTDQFGCAIAWMPIMFLEGARQTRNVASSVDSMRNETIQRQDEFLHIVKGVRHETTIVDSIGSAGDGTGSRLLQE